MSKMIFSLMYLVTSLGQPMEVLKTHVSAYPLRVGLVQIVYMSNYFFSWPQTEKTLYARPSKRHGLVVVSQLSIKASFHGSVVLLPIETPGEQLLTRAGVAGSIYQGRYLGSSIK